MGKYEIVVVGSGLGGSACALVLSKLGYRVAMIERGSHPRFTIGESATPVTSKKIRYLGELYGIPEFDAFSSYDMIQKSELNIICGPKELFHYYVHEKNQVSVYHKGRIPEFIVQTPEVDAQYLRADSDAFMVNLAKTYGVTYFENTAVKEIDFNDNIVFLQLSQGKSQRNLETDFVIDATGFRSIIGNKFQLKISDNDLDTPLKSRCIFSHFTNVGDFEKLLQQSEYFIDESPAPRCRATQHHCFDGGWLWVIPFDNEVTSIGLSLDMDIYPINDKDAATEFWSIINQYPLLQNLLQNAQPLRPLIKTERMQFCNREMVGARWAMLPSSAYGLDAWFSTGLAGTFIAIHRLVEILNERVFPKKHFKRELFLDYETAMKQEFKQVSRMINGMYKSFKHYDVFKNFCSLCFMGSESYMASGGIQKGMDMSALLLNSGNQTFIDKFESIYSKVILWSTKEEVSEAEIALLEQFLREDMKEFNYRRFGDPAMHSMHPRVVIA